MLITVLIAIKVKYFINIDLAQILIEIFAKCRNICVKICVKLQSRNDIHVIEILCCSESSAYKYFINLNI